MSKWRKAAKIDSNQPKIVDLLTEMEGVSVQVGMDDIVVGYKGFTLWYEIKNPECANKQGVVFESAKKASQIKLENEWTGHYRIVTNIGEIVEDLDRIDSWHITFLISSPPPMVPSQTQSLFGSA